MLERQQWVDHFFNLGIDNGWMQNVLTRIKDAPFRIAHHCQNMSDDNLSIKENGKWSIKEQIGHLIDLEDLWINRFKQFEDLVPELVHADMSNQKTEHANHNDKTIKTLVDEFTEERIRLTSTFESLSTMALEHTTLHPRLKVPMRPIDLLFFVAEHDDHHITSILASKVKLT